MLLKVLLVKTFNTNVMKAFATRWQHFKDKLHSRKMKKQKMFL